jgi:hypothetical protein
MLSYLPTLHVMSNITLKHVSISASQQVSPKQKAEMRRAETLTSCSSLPGVGFGGCAARAREDFIQFFQGVLREFDFECA